MSAGAHVVARIQRAKEKRRFAGGGQRLATGMRSRGATGRGVESSALGSGFRLPEDAGLLAQEVNDPELAGGDPARHPQEQEPLGLGAYRGAM